jgi:hypothetical protein
MTYVERRKTCPECYRDFLLAFDTTTPGGRLAWVSCPRHPDGTAWDPASALAPCRGSVQADVPGRYAALPAD